ncbi:hypothetical protein ACFOMD_14630 [Sphingoaurantiacus capsulatus]|uniref:Uncharacterized protein n=1 Tax=Sphingoaurantiacus capsulatus TaxID=1771310 RepID=A0ABV7XCI0_9SPHN
MRHMNIADLKPVDVAPFPVADLGSLDSLSRELTLAAASGDERVRLLNAMQMLGNIRDYLVSPLSDEAENLIDAAIQQLMHRERQLPATWRAA